MAARILWISDDKKRDAQIAAEAPPRAEKFSFVAPGGNRVRTQRLVKTTEGHTYDALLKKHADPAVLAQALVTGDPEIDLQSIGRKLDDADRVYVKPDGTVLYTARVLQVSYDAAGAEKARADFVDVEATVKEDVALPWSGRLFSVEEVVRKFAIVRNLRLRHVNGLTFDFLFDIAKTLHDSGKMLLVGAGAKGTQPLIFNTNGAPYRGFLEGRINGDGYLLILHLSNLELKAVSQ